ncbi:LacI family DNA-binding transcriptional regulator [Glycomyces algeriensis]|uniref:LacI family transcriptional regulator n=1 Tax=Glycomyces algeriensis TaxID=256037 RepID=A0A9W6GBX2_9ACTN|nr:LacI family DNA-binding transcriptional regulator [Glycomyces algeriensis]MDA1365678.1 LacI family DNA-binding transcriptional regulator [Glycomyces algeriensis]MDR7351366.1 DNA-binding LacI/PurR family transcriptional regulator [Glycomyces algeriensis]GLI44081.1 LacI family transcriptional regulator [Glycomyces algeriensis]
MGKRPTSHDVARHAGVSQSTVSFVFTGRAGISTATREKVLRSAEALNYRPNLAARSMRTQRTGRLAIVIPFPGLSLGSLLEGAVTTAREAGYTVELVNLSQDAEALAQEVDAVLSSFEYEGVLSFSPIPTPRSSSAASAPAFLALSEFDEEMHATGAFSDAHPLVEMMEHLVGLGHRRFLHIAGPSDYPAAVARRDAYLATVDRLGLESVGVVGGNWSGIHAGNCVRELPDDLPPLAIIAANDVLAAGAIRAAVQRGWSVPEDVSVTGWDDLPLSLHFLPSITTVSQDRQRLGAYAMRRLVAAIRGDGAPEPETHLQQVIWRESVAPPRT